MTPNNGANAGAPSSFWAILVLLWVILGFVAFIWSLTCFGRGGNISQNLGGFLMALFLGPFYFIYLAWAGGKYGYCKAPPQYTRVRVPVEEYQLY